jgi:hypothetical protein
MQFDNMRGLGVLYTANKLNPNSSNAEGGVGADEIQISSTGLTVANVGNNAQFIYIAIRRGPMKVPTSGTSVYNAIARTGTDATATLNTIGFPPDLAHIQARSVTMTSNFQDRLRGQGFNLRSEVTTQEQFDSASVTSFDQNGVTLGADGCQAASTPRSAITPGARRKR